MKKRRTIALVVLSTIILMLLTMYAFVTAEAKTVLVTSDNENDTVISVDGKVQTGWFRLKGRTYYAYRTGELAKNCYRIRNGKLYYLGGDGAVLKKSDRYIILHRDHSVKYVKIAGMENILRFNADERRYEYRDSNGNWRPTGQQVWPYGMIDRRK